MSAPDYIRAFVAIELNDDLRSALGKAQARLRKARVSYIGRWVAPDSIHLTLSFLGDVAPSRIAQISQVLETACLSVPTFSIALSGLGCFPHPQRPRVIWIGVTGDLVPLEQLQRKVETGLQDLGFAPERRRFQPHLTLARIKDSASPSERGELANWMEATKAPSSPPMMVSELSLIRSELRPSGAVYTRLAAVPLTG